jgi:hypothetical protein
LLIREVGEKRMLEALEYDQSRPDAHSDPSQAHPIGSVHTQSRHAGFAHISRGFFWRFITLRADH